MQEAHIQDFWQHHPCGDHQVGGLGPAFSQDYETFFREYDAFRYRREGHILGCLDGIHFSGKKILEIGLGQGADSEQIIRRGGRWSGLDLTAESIARVRTRLQLRNLPYDDIRTLRSTWSSVMAFCTMYPRSVGRRLKSLVS
jgi:2-polyprenyl-3-methyl-5-hydroxy-6-metoxy-1,4-benzoquinol methylase